MNATSGPGGTRSTGAEPSAVDEVFVTKHLGATKEAPRHTRPAVEVVCVGETMAMVTPERSESLATASRLALYPGGAESNVAMYLSSLGHRTAWVSRVGDDPLGRRLVADVAREGVDTSLVDTDSIAPTGVFFKDPGASVTPVYYYRRHSAASLMGPEVAHRIWHIAPKVLHITGITPALSESCNQLIETLIHRDRSSAAVTVSFDVNFRPALWPSPARAGDRLGDIAQAADVVFVGMDEASRLWGANSPAEVRALITRPDVLVIKEGPVGATAYHGTATTFVPAIKVDVVEPVGAGDAFAAGWLSGMLRSGTPAGCLRLGHLAARAALRSTADYARLPGRRLISIALSASEELWASISAEGNIDPNMLSDPDAIGSPCFIEPVE